MVSEGYAATLVAATLAISRSSLYYRNKAQGSKREEYVVRRLAPTMASRGYIGCSAVLWSL
jgi:hypothetical protein